MDGYEVILNLAFQTGINFRFENASLNNASENSQRRFEATRLYCNNR
jgi:hypothetical protein